MLDAIDRKLLAALQECNRASLESLAETVGSSRSAVGRRLRRLRLDRVIRREIAIVDQRRVGPLETFIIHTEVHRGNGSMASAFLAGVRELPEVQQCYLTTGTINCVLIVVVRDSSAIETFVDEHLVDNPFIRTFTTSLVTRSVKVGLGVPTGLLDGVEV